MFCAHPPPTPPSLKKTNKQKNNRNQHKANKLKLNQKIFLNQHLQKSLENFQEGVSFQLRQLSAKLQCY